MKSAFNITVKQFIFTPRLLPTLLTVILFPVFIVLGIWQLQRAEQKEIILQQYQTFTHTAPLNLAQIHDPIAQQFFPVALHGSYDNQHSFLLDNRSYQGQVGYQVLTPFIIKETQQVLLVNRGWVARGRDRQQLPIIPVVTGEQTIQGKIYVPPSRKFLLRAETDEAQFPRVAQTFDIAWMSKMSQQTLLSWALLLDPNLPYGFVRDWQPNISPYKNWGYAMQWFSFAGVLLIIYIALNLRRRK